MRNNPLLDFGICVVLLSVLAWPVARLTHQEAPAEVNPHGDHVHIDDEEMIDAWIELKASCHPDTIEIHQGDKLLWRMPGNSGKDMTWSDQIQLHLEDHSCELLLKGGWTEQNHEAALQLIIEPDGLPAESVVLWAGESLDEIVEFSWE